MFGILSFAVGKVYDLKLEALRPETSLMMYVVIREN